MYVTCVTKESQMKEILDEALKAKYIKQYQIHKMFDTTKLDFHLYRYEVGEYMNIKRSPVDYLKFIVAGTWDIYSVTNEGKPFLLRRARPLALMGDIEFFSGMETGNLQEVRETVYSLKLSLDKCRTILLDDNTFLRFLCRELTQKFVGNTAEFTPNAGLEKSLLHYMKYECEDNRITNVEETAFYLNRSRRQLQRVLKKLVDEKKLVKEGRGQYRILP